MLSSRPADSLEELALKSSYPSPPLIINTSRLEPVPDGRGAVVVEGEVPGPFSLVLSCVPSFGTSTAVRKRTCPVCPWKDAVADGQFRREAVLAVIVGSGNVNTTPALVPIQSRSLHASRAVTRKQAALCWRMIASEPTENKTAALTICFTHPHKSAKDHGRVRMLCSVSVCLFVLHWSFVRTRAAFKRKVWSEYGNGEWYWGEPLNYIHFLASHDRARESTLSAPRQFTFLKSSLVRAPSPIERQRQKNPAVLQSLLTCEHFMHGRSDIYIS